MTVQHNIRKIIICSSLLYINYYYLLYKLLSLSIFIIKPYDTRSLFLEVYYFSNFLYLISPLHSQVRNNYYICNKTNEQTGNSYKIGTIAINIDLFINSSVQMITLDLLESKIK